MSDGFITYTVSQLNAYVKGMIENDSNLSCIYLSGEISNFTNHYKSGHFYLTLKDDKALIKAVMFRSSAQRIRFEPQNGMKVICRGRVSLFERDGQYQFYIDDMQPDGAGALQIAFEQLTKKLRAEGLFDESRKKPIPKFPERIAVITSPTGAAVQDIKNVLGRRYPVAEIVMCPVLVQGDMAAAQLVCAVRKVNAGRLADTIIIGRGGGSLEDLWAFNDETLARTIADSEIPVISAVGHETDFTICDFAADLRAPTPSAAAELAVPDARDVAEYILNLRQRVNISVGRVIDRDKLRADRLIKNRSLSSPMGFIERLSERLDYSVRDLTRVFTVIVTNNRNKLAKSAAKLDALSPLSTLSRGYSISFKGEKAIRTRDDVEVGDNIDLMLSDGKIKCIVESK